MELSFSLFPILFTFTLFILMILKLLKQSNKPNLPPGPWKLPIIGSIHHVASSLPHRRFKELAEKYGPLMHLQLGELSVVVVSSTETAREVMKTHDVNFANRPFNPNGSVMAYGGCGIATAPYGEYWRQLRNICNLELMSSKQVQSLRSVREKEVSNFINSISQSTGLPVNLSKRIPTLNHGITASAAFGKKREEEDAFISLVNDSVKVGGGFSLINLFPSSKLLALLGRIQPELERIHNGFDKILNNIIEEHKTSRDAEGEVRNDLVDVLLKVQEHGKLEVPLSHS